MSKSVIARLGSGWTAVRLYCTVLCLACLTLHGCGRSDPAAAPDLLKAQREALEKAKGTEKALQDAAGRQSEQIESQQK